MSNLVAQPLLPKSLSGPGRVLFVLLCCCLAGPRAWADDRATVRVFTQDFYKAYIAAKDPEKFIAKSDKITPGFKKVYAAYMKKDHDSDPILQGQDVPASGYQAGAIEVNGDKATVTMTTRDKGFTTLKVDVIRSGQTWLLNGVNGLKGK